MLKRHEQERIYALIKEGFAITEIAERLGVSLATVYKYRKLNGQLVGGNYTKSSIPTELVPFIDFLGPKIKSRSIKPTTLFFMLQREGYHGSRRVFDTYYVRRKQELKTTRTIKHLETAPGEQAQVDWGHFGEMIINGKREKVYLFSFILSYSRAIYMEFVVRQNQRTLQNCHINAFNALGIPKTILYDNMKTVVNRREKLMDGSKKVVYNLMFLDFARYYQFKPKACAPYYPQSKGKVESSIKLARQYFSRTTPSVKQSIEELNENLQQWINKIANVRMHSSTRQRPYDMWLKEKEHLSFPANLPKYNLSAFRSYFTTQYGYFSKGGIIYNLGGNYARMKLDVREVDDHGLPMLEIYRHNQLLKRVPIPSKRNTWVSIDVPKVETSPTIVVSDKAPKNNTVKKRMRNFDIVVAQRDDDYYASVFNFVKRGNNG